MRFYLRSVLNLLTGVRTPPNVLYMNTNTTTRQAAALQIGDKIATRDGKFLKVTGLDITPAAVRIRTGRSQQWSRSKADAIFTVSA